MSMQEEFSGKEDKKKSLTVQEDSGPAIKSKLLLTLSPEHPLSQFQNEMKVRGVRDYDINDIVQIALQEVSAEWWKSKIEELTPLEYRVNSALSDPQMREKLSELLVPRSH